MPKKINIPLLSAALYIAFQLFANILSTKIALLPLIHLSVDGGTVIYPFTFTLRDFVHKTWGKRQARFVVVLAASLNIVMVVLFWLIGKMQPDPTWPFQEAYNSILMPVWRITVGSIIAQVIAELIDTELFSVIYKKAGQKFGDMLGVFCSNGIALVFDSVIFSVIAFAGVLPWSTVVQIIISNILIKLVITIISVPTIKLIPATAEKSEL